MKIVVWKMQDYRRFLCKVFALIWLHCFAFKKLIIPMIIGKKGWISHIYALLNRNLIKPLNLSHYYWSTQGYLRTSNKLEKPIFTNGLMNLSAILKIPDWCPERICCNSSLCHVPPSCPSFLLAALISLVLATNDFILLTFGLVLGGNVSLS